MVYFIDIRKTDHYINEHEHEFPWSEVTDIIFKSLKNIRKKGEKYEIETGKYYVLLEIRGNVAYVINAKRRR